MRPEDVLATYTTHAAAFARQRSKSLFERGWLDRFLAACPRNVGKPRVLDLGCGSGAPIATYLAERGAGITGVDGAAAMTELFAQTLPQAEVVTADMRGLNLDTMFDGILAWDSFFHLSVEDQRAMFAVFAAHAAPKAALMLTTGPDAGEAIGDVNGAPIYHASLSPDEYAALLDDHGFKVLSFTPEDPACGGHSVWLARRR